MIVSNWNLFNLFLNFKNEKNKWNKFLNIFYTHLHPISLQLILNSIQFNINYIFGLDLWIWIQFNSIILIQFKNLKSIQFKNSTQVACFVIQHIHSSGTSFWQSEYDLFFHQLVANSNMYQCKPQVYYTSLLYMNIF